MSNIVYSSSPEEISYDNIIEIAKLHKAGISEGFLSTLSIRFLSRLYRFILNDKNSFLCIATIDDKVGGYVSGTLNIKQMYRKALTGKLFFSSILLLPRVFSKDFIKKIIQTIVYPFTDSKNDENENHNTEAELLSIVVSPDFRNMGIAKSLYLNLYNFFKNEDIDAFKIVVGRELEGSRKFYKSVGAEEIAEISIHSDNDSVLFIHQI